MPWMNGKRPQLAKGSASMIVTRWKHGRRVIAICQPILMIAMDKDELLAGSFYPKTTESLPPRRNSLNTRL
jgi:hypothetical protein